MRSQGPQSDGRVSLARRGVPAVETRRRLGGNSTRRSPPRRPRSPSVIGRYGFYRRCCMRPRHGHLLELGRRSRSAPHVPRLAGHTRVLGMPQAVHVLRELRPTQSLLAPPVLAPPVDSPTANLESSELFVARTKDLQLQTRSGFRQTMYSQIRLNEMQLPTTLCICQM